MSAELDSCDRATIVRALAVFATAIYTLEPSEHFKQEEPQDVLRLARELNIESELRAEFKRIHRCMEEVGADLLAVIAARKMDASQLAGPQSESVH